MFQFTKKMIVVGVTIIFFVGLDRWLKVFALANQGRQLSLLGEILKLDYKANYYIAFSLPLAGQLLAIMISLIVVVLIFFAVRYAQRREISKLSALSFIVMGASSNLFDRIKYGFVIDYLDLKYFTIFNLADAMIVAGVILLIVIFYKGDSLSGREYIDN